MKPSSAKPHPGATVGPVPMLDLRRQYDQIRPEILAAIERVCASQRFILGEEVEALEKEIAPLIGGAMAIGCSSGTDALWLALVAAGVQPGDAVVTTPFSFFASASAIVRAGARPVFADIDPQTLNLDPAQLEIKLSAGGAYQIRAVLPVHLYGQCADMNALRRVADEFGLTIIEDAAQAIGAAWEKHRAGSMGETAAFSFYPSKNLSAYGDAGLATTCDPELAERLRRLRNHGSTGRYIHEEMGWNCRLDAIQAAILRVKLPYIERWNAERRERAATYRRLLEQAGFSDGESSPVRPLTTAPPALHVFHQYVVRAQQRDKLRRFLEDRGIGSEIYYPMPLHRQPCFAYLGYLEGDLPRAEQASREVMALPMFPELSEEEQRWVVESIAEFYSRA